MTGFDSHVTAVLGLIESVRRPGLSTLIAVAGPPGSGKSTLGERVVGDLNGRNQPSDRARLVPMDGFHLENSVLDARGLRAVKGAPETFDVDGFLALVRALRQSEADVWYPLFDRAHDRTIPRAGCVPKGTPIIVVEGNYLLLRSGGWPELKPLFDATVMIAPSIQTLENRLIDRWLQHGLPLDGALRRVRGNDLLNAAKVMGDSFEADLELREFGGP